MAVAKNDPFTSLLDSGAQEQRAQVLFNCAGADVEFRRNLLIAATLHQRLQYVMVAAR
jgi:hypothetical protein